MNGVLSMYKISYLTFLNRYLYVVYIFFHYLPYVSFSIVLNQMFYINFSLDAFFVHRMQLDVFFPDRFCREVSLFFHIHLDLFLSFMFSNAMVSIYVYAFRFQITLCVLFFTYILKPHTFPGLKVNQFLVPSFELNRNLHSLLLFKKLLCLSPIHPHQNEYIHY